MERVWRAAGARVSHSRVAGLVLVSVLGASSSAWAQFAQVVSFSRSATGTASAAAGASSNGPVPLSSSSGSWSQLAFSTINVPANANAADLVCGPNGVISEGSARVDQYVSITSADHFEIASTVYGIATVSAHPCTTLSGSANGSTSCNWHLVFNALSPTTLTLNRANAAVTGGNSAGADASVVYTITGPSGLVNSDSLLVTDPTGFANTQGPVTLALQPGQYSVQINASAAETANGNGSGSAGGTAYAGFDLTFNFGPGCDTIDFNGDTLFPDTADIDDFLSVFSGDGCSNDPNCGDIDFNNDTLFPDTLDIDALLSVFSGGACLA